MDETSRPRRRGKRLAIGVAGALVLVGGGVAVTAATGASQDPAHQLRAWALNAPALPLPAADPAAAADDSDGSDDASADAGAATRDGERPAGEQRDRLPSGAASDAEVQAALARALGAESGGEGLVSRATLNRDGTATIPPDAPARVAAIIQAGNEVARKPYVYGGGHGRFANSVWSDTAYDCSGSISFTLAAAGMINHPMTSGALADWGEPGPGKWVTIYAHAEHAFMYVAGLRFDTSGRQITGSRWQTAPRNMAGFRVVHPKGL